LIRGIYFFAFSVLRLYGFSIVMCVLYMLILHEFSFFSLVIGFPLSLVFYMKFSSMSLRFILLSCLFLFPVVLGVHLGSLPVAEEVLVSFRLLILFV